MQRSSRSLLLAAAVIGLACPVTAQKFVPKAIRFQGDPEYSNQELMAAAGLKKGTVLGFSEMSGYTQRLLASGMFSTAAFKFDGQDLIFSLAPSPDVYPVRLANLPIAAGPALDARLHDLLPLYHGKVPADGGLAEQVRVALQKILAEQGVTAVVAATTAADLATGKINAVDYSLTSPPVSIGNVRLEGVSAQDEPLLRKALASVVQLPFDTAHSGPGLQHVAALYYQDRGYAGVKVQAAISGPAQITPSGIFVPFSLSIQPGRLYTISSIQLPSGSPVSDAEIAKILSDKKIPLGGVRVRTVWSLLADRYHAQGRLDCKITPHATFNDAAGTVSYTADVIPGPVYHLAFVKFDNVSDGLRSELMRSWQMMPGDPFNQSYVGTFVAKAEMQDPQLRASLAGVKQSFDVTADPNTHTVDVVIHFTR